MRRLFRCGIDVILFVPVCIGYYFIVIRPTQQMRPLFDEEDKPQPAKKPPGSPLP